MLIILKDTADVIISVLNHIILTCNVLGNVFLNSPQSVHDINDIIARR